MESDERRPLLPKRQTSDLQHNDLSSSHCSINNGTVGTGDSVTICDSHAITNHASELKDTPLQKVCKRRWYILMLFALMGFMQNAVWNTWGPLSQSVKIAFGWTNADIALQTNWGCITYIISAAFYSWLMDVKGLRISCVMTSGLVFFGCALRCITTEPRPATFLIHTAQILNGFAGPVLMAGPPVLSSIWFPAYQRTTATSLAVLFQSLGIAGSFLIGPLLVPVDASTDVNSTVFSNETVAETRFNIMKLMYIECVCSVAVFLAVLIYFPDRPRLPPSVSASSNRIDFKAGMRQLLRHWSFWKISISYALALGISGIWASLLSLYTLDLITEGEAGWLGFYGSIACGVAGCIFSRFTDIYARRQKCVLIFLYIFSLCTCIVFSLECMKHIPFHRGILYTTYIGSSASLQGCSPLFYELICETAFPIAEGLTNGIQTWLNNFVGLIFLLVFLIPAVGNSSDMQWMNWTMVGATATCIPILLTYKESYNRLDIDTITVSNEETETHNSFAERQSINTTDDNQPVA